MNRLMTFAVAQENIIRKLLKVAAEQPFLKLWEEWRRFVRHYCDMSSPNLVTVKCGSVQVPYGWNYHGCKYSLVRTQLTHEAYYATMESAFAQSQSLMLIQGPAGE